MASMLEYLKEQHRLQSHQQGESDRVVAMAARNFLREKALRLFGNNAQVTRITETWVSPLELNKEKGVHVSAQAIAEYFEKHESADFAVTRQAKDNFDQTQAGDTWTEYYLYVKSAAS